MFKHILIPTDGSDLSNIAASSGVQFAQEIGARITGLTVTTPYHYVTANTMQVVQMQEQFEREMQHMTQRNLQFLQREAELRGVPCDALSAISDHPYEEIVRMAEQQRCDVIFMASHGRRGLRALLMGSETHKVLTHTKIPVLVYR
jgi:nucleotide-binding universal stress UspA family protein